MEKAHFLWHCFLSMGSRSSVYCCQKFTNTISFITFKLGIHILNYLDDSASAETNQNAYFAYNTMQVMSEKCGFEEANNNACHPSTSMIFVGVLFNTQSMTIEITAERLKEIISLLTSWLNKEKASLKEIQSLLGKLNFIAACVRPGRVFISRMLRWLNVLYKEDANLLYVLPCVILFLWFSVLLELRLPRLGKRELILVLFVRMFDLCLFGFVSFLFLLVSGTGCSLWLWHSLDFSLIFCFLHIIPSYVKKDILWWHNFLPYYNGVSMMLYEKWCFPDSVFFKWCMSSRIMSFLGRQILSLKIPNQIHK